jgi:hypothetical protein
MKIYKPEDLILTIKTKCSGAHHYISVNEKGQMILHNHDVKTHRVFYAVQPEFDKKNSPRCYKVLELYKFFSLNYNIYDVFYDKQQEVSPKSFLKGFTLPVELRKIASNNRNLSLKRFKNNKNPFSDVSDYKELEQTCARSLKSLSCKDQISYFCNKLNSMMFDSFNGDILRNEYIKYMDLSYYSESFHFEYRGQSPYFYISNDTLRIDFYFSVFLDFLLKNKKLKIQNLPIFYNMNPKIYSLPLIYKTSSFLQFKTFLIDSSSSDDMIYFLTTEYQSLPSEEQLSRLEKDLRAVYLPHDLKYKIILTKEQDSSGI